MDHKFNKSSEEDLKEIKKFVEENYWKVRDCEHYNIELKECASLSGKFHQYFTTGKFADCKKWSTALSNCRKCSNKDYGACAEVIKHEDGIKERRLQAHYENDVWKQRTAPPADWSKELPDWVKEKTSESFPNLEATRSTCVIS